MNTVTARHQEKDGHSGRPQEDMVEEVIPELEVTVISNPLSNEENGEQDRIATQFECVQVLIRENDDRVASRLCGQVVRLYANPPWNTQLGFLCRTDRVLLVDTILRLSPGKEPSLLMDSSGLMVVCPSELVSCTTLGDANRCPRIIYAKKMQGEDAISAKPFLGTLMHQMIARAVRSKESIEEAQAQVITTNLEKAAVLKLTPEKIAEMTKDSIPKLTKLANSYSDTEPEQVLLSTKFGLLGSADFLTDSAVYEFKSGASKRGEARPSHRLQVQAYGLMLADSRGTTPTMRIDYIGDTGKHADRIVTVPVKHEKWTIGNLVRLRNIVFAVQAGRWIPPVRGSDGAHDCTFCFVRNQCRSFCEGMEETRHCDDCSLSDECDQKPLPRDVLSYMRRFHELIQVESAAVQGRTRAFLTEAAESKVNAGRAFWMQVPVPSEQEGVVQGDSNETNDADGMAKFPVAYNGSYIIKGWAETKSDLRKGDFIWMHSDQLGTGVVSQGILVDAETGSITVLSSAPLEGRVFVEPHGAKISERRQRRALFDFAYKTSSEKQQSLIFPQDSPVPLNELDCELNLDEYQQEAVRMCLSERPICLIHGPPGSGKTRTIAELVRLLVSRGKRVLVSAYTNTAVDNMVENILGLREQDQERMASSGVPELTRLGSLQSMSARVREYVKGTDMLARMQSLQRDSETIQLDEWLVGKKDQDGNMIERIVRRENTMILAATTTTIAKPDFNHLRFDYVILDEASQMTEPSSLGALLKGEHLVLVGDDNQLPPLVVSQQAASMGLAVSAFARYKNLLKSDQVLLRKQYRMREEISSFPSDKFYDGKLIVGNSHIQNRTLSLPNLQKVLDELSAQNEWLRRVLDPEEPFVMIQFPGSFDNRTRRNLDEVCIAGIILEHLVRAGIQPEQLGVIAPHRAQVAVLREQLAEYVQMHFESKLTGDSDASDCDAEERTKRRVKFVETTDTVDRFQGQDRDVILLSLTNSEHTSPGSLVADPNRLNVAITRAKVKLIVLMSEAAFELDPLLKELHDHSSTSNKVIRVEEQYYRRELTELLRKHNVSEDTSRGERQQEAPDRFRFCFGEGEFGVTVCEDSTDLTANRAVCLLCYQEIEQDDTHAEPVTICPNCGSHFHSRELAVFVRENGNCPDCGIKCRVLGSSNSD